MKPKVEAIFKMCLGEIAERRKSVIVYEYRFHSKRKWRFDAAFPHIMLGVEVDGSVWVQGRHTRGSGFIKDQEKFREAAILGWRVMRFCTQDVLNGVMASDIERYFDARNT